MKTNLTTRELYFKALVESELPVRILGYVYIDSSGMVQIGANIHMVMSTDEKLVKKNIKRMECIENTKGFMFWSHTDECKEFLEKNKKEISSALTNFMFNLKFE